MPQVSIVIQLQELAANSATPIPDLLRKALLISTKLNLVDFRDWILGELNGYDDPQTVPDYRIIYGEVKVHNPYRGYIPFLLPPEIANVVRKIDVAQSVDAISDVLAESQGQIITFPFPPAAEALLMSWQDSFAQLRPVRVVARNQLVGILEQVRTTILEWSLRLEADGILGEGLLFSETEKRRAEMNQNINIHNFQGVLGDISDSSIQQNLTMTVESKNFSSLATHLASHGVTTGDILDLEQAIKDDPAPTDKAKLGTRVSAWIGGMLGKAAQGSWEIGVGTAANILASAIAKYYGLS